MCSKKVPETAIDARLLIVYCSRETTGGMGKRIGRRYDTEPVRLSGYGLSVPLYGSVVTFTGDCSSRLLLEETNEPVMMKREKAGMIVLHIGFNLFDEISRLLLKGQPVGNACIPVLDYHIMLLKLVILDYGRIPVIEIPPVHPRYSCMVALTHDVDFVSIRKHFPDLTFIAYLYRATIGSLLDVVRGKRTVRHLVRNLISVFSLPFVLAGAVKDFWNQFKEYVKLEKGLTSTFYVIPFKGRTGKNQNAGNVKRRASRYDIDDIGDEIMYLDTCGNEVGVHGLDSWNSESSAQSELNRVREIIGRDRKVGIRMHWLFFNENTPRHLERGGYFYDSSYGYNETVGFRAGTSQVFRFPGVSGLYELPMHIQDSTMFYPGRMNLKESEAWAYCEHIFNEAAVLGGAVTVIWHMRSIAPERLWDNFYKRLLDYLKARKVWVTKALDIVMWFHARRSISFTNMTLANDLFTCDIEYENSTADSRVLENTHQIRCYRPGGAKTPVDTETLKNYTVIPWGSTISVSLD